MTTKPKPSGQAFAASKIDQLPIEKLHANPHNRTPKPEAIAELAESLRDNGQSEPILVRPSSFLQELPIGHYEIVAGETRWRAARKLNWLTIAARIQHLADAEALVELAVSNTARRNLDPIERARMIQTLTKPTEQDGAGLTLERAGQIYGLESESAVRNSLGLLRLPEKWQQRVISGEMFETAARALVPYAGHAKLMQAIDKEYRQSQTNRYGREDWQSRSGAKQRIELAIKQHSRPVDAKTKHPYGWQLGGDHPRRFQLTQELRDKLEIVSLPLGKNGKRVERALNCKLYDQQQLPAIKAWQAKQEARRRSPLKRKSGGTTQESEQLRSQQREKQVTQRRQLWRIQFLRLAIAETIRPGHWQCAAMLPILADAQKSAGYAGASMAEMLKAAMRHNSCDSARKRNESGKFYLPASPALSNLAAEAFDTLEQSDDPVDEVEHLLYLICRFTLWPATPSPNDEADELLAPGLPFHALPYLSDELVEKLAELTGADLAQAWRRGAIAGSRERPMVERFFALHFSDQLDQLAEELLKRWPVAEQFGAHQTKSDKVAALLKAHTNKQPLPLPKSLQPKRQKAKRK